MALHPPTEKRNELHSIITRVITAIERITTKKSEYYIRVEELLKKKEDDRKKVVHDQNFVGFEFVIEGHNYIIK